MHIVVVDIWVRPDSLDDFLIASRENVRATLKEQGVVRFDLLLDAEDPTRFLLVEVYRRAEDHAAHKATAHYKRWAAVAEPLMSAPRTRRVYHSAFPEESGWA